MNTIKAFSITGIAAAGLLLAGQALATPASPPSNPGTCPVASGGQQTYPGPVCIAPYGSDGPLTGLPEILSAYDATTNPNGVFTAGSPSVNPWTAQVEKPLWSVSGSSGSVSTILLQIAGMANGYTFGIYDPNNSSNKLNLFGAGGTTTANGGQALLSTGAGGTYWVNLQTTQKVTFSTTNLFGFFLTTPTGNTFYSAPSLNGGDAHMVAYQGNGVGSIRPMNGLSGGLWDTAEYIQAWEDLPYGSSDLDFNDFVVLIESIHPVPEPAVLGIFGLGTLMIVGLVALRRRRESEAA